MKKCFSVASQTLLAKCVVLLLFQSGSVNVAISQLPTIQWQKTLGGTLEDIGSSISNTADSGMIFAGVVRSGDGNVVGHHGAMDLWVVKQSKSGVIQWQKALGGTRDERGTIVLQSKDGGYIVGGTTASNNGDVSGNHGGVDIWIVKLTSQGVIQWQKCLGGNGTENLASVKETSTGELYVGGTTSSANGNVTGFHGGIDYWAVKLSATGVLLWQKALGGTSEEITNQLKLTPDGGCILAGTTSSANGDVTNYRGGTRDYWIVKLSSAGIVQWKKTLGGSGDEMRIGIEVLSNGYAIGGRTTSVDGDVVGNHGQTDLWIVKLSTAGAILWKRTMGGSNFEEFYAIKTTADKGLIIGASTNSTNYDVTRYIGGEDIWIIKLDSNGVKKWSNFFGSPQNDWVEFIQQTRDGGYIVNGVVTGTGGDVSGYKGGADTWALKLDAAGVVKWKRAFGGARDEWLDGTNSGLAGYYIPRASINDNYQLQALDGNYMFITSTNSSNGDVTGLHYNSRLGYQRDLWIVKFAPPSTTITTSIVNNRSLNDMENGIHISAFPNPFTQKATIRYTARQTGRLSAQLYDVGGLNVQMLMDKDVVRGEVCIITINGSQLPKGTYLYRIHEKGKVAEGKLVKQ